ncbi:MAG: hypothetical protein JSS62_04050 [Verrucomicrobia bacterium]|nr:hypothetical protein [Verrucomicrobiota bacterium]MBS0647214.1 hypothetical protein [Verrucomicrobiota bacterium]
MTSSPHSVDSSSALPLSYAPKLPRRFLSFSPFPLPSTTTQSTTQNGHTPRVTILSRSDRTPLTIAESKREQAFTERLNILVVQRQEELRKIKTIATIMHNHEAISSLDAFLKDRLSNPINFRYKTKILKLKAESFAWLSSHHFTCLQASLDRSSYLRSNRYIVVIRAPQNKILYSSILPLFKAEHLTYLLRVVLNYQRQCD